MKRFFHWRGHHYLVLIARLYIGYIFIYASLHKIAHPASFALDIATYDILPLFLVNVQAITLPWLEIVSGVLVVIGFRTKGAALTIVGMMVMFIVAISIALYNGLDTSCGCFASQSVAEEDPISYLTILRDVGWLAIAGYIVVFDKAKLGLDGYLQRRRRQDEN